MSIKQGTIVFLIKNGYEPVPYIVANIDKNGFCMLISISPYGSKDAQRISVDKKNIKNNCFDEVECFDIGENFGEYGLSKELITENKPKIDKWIEKRKKETGCDF
jgi:hypothetical protein